MDLKVGDKVWIFDSNRRVYQDDKGNKLKRCWYKGYFVEREIEGETKQSWIINYQGEIKVNKKTLRYKAEYGKDGKLHTSEEEIDRECWINDNHYEIKEKVGQCNDYDKLKRIELILSE